MRENFWNTHSVLAAMTLGASDAFLVLNGFYLFQGVVQTPDQILECQLRIGAALALWAVGCGMTSRTHHGSWTRGLFCGIFFLPGLWVLLLTTGRKTRQELWEREAAKRERQHRNVKPLTEIFGGEPIILLLGRPLPPEYHPEMPASMRACRGYITWSGIIRIWTSFQKMRNQRNPLCAGGWLVKTGMLM
ncbi:MAG: hypothetical protein JWM59_3634 [Verrucomicrobiales bacterium]|nr:hypothetical protein [Verrucomicrobiales bacterium]